MTTVVRQWAQEAIEMDKGHERHDAVLELLVQRLIQKPNYISIMEEYRDENAVLKGEMDIHTFRRIRGAWHHRYYEVKAHYSDGAEERAHQQFERHKQHHKGQNWKYILVTPEVVKQYK